MSLARLRSFLKWSHIALGLVVMCYVYSPFGEKVPFQVVVKFFVIPWITLSGVWMWKFKSVNAMIGIKEK